MTLTNWIGIALGAVIIIIGSVLLVYFRRKFKNLEGFEGIITEADGSEVRNHLDWETERELLVKELNR